MGFAWVSVDRGRKDVLTAGLEGGLDTFVLPEDAVEDLARLGRFRALTVTDDAVVEDNERIGARVRIATPEDQDRALALAGKEDLLLVDARDWKIIPLENLIAACRGRTTLVAEATTAKEAALFLETLEVGVDGVLLRSDDPAEVRGLADVLQRGRAGDVDLATATVTAVRPVGSGERICLDTTALLDVGEGVLTGNSSGALFLVASEARDSGYVASRPFRVNAGPVHAYTLLPGGRTKYLAELRSGDEVLAVDREGRSRVVTLGRVKIEHRPLLLVEAEVDGRAIATLLQNAETVHLTTPDGTRSVSDLAPGDQVLVRLEAGGRHFGTAIDESIVER